MNKPQLLLICFLTISYVSDAIAQQTSSLGDTLGAFNAGVVTPTPDRALRGIEFADGHYWITGNDPDAGWQRKLYKFSADGQTLVQYWTYSSLMENWSDLAYDGDFLYGAGIDTIYQIDMLSGQRTGVQWKSPIYYNSGITYDPASDHFWVSGDGNIIYEINRQGNIINSLAFIQDLPTAGLAWDTWTTGGPYLWVYSMKYTSTDVRPKFYQMQPSTGQLTGVSFEGVNMNPFGVDGALSFTLTDEVMSGEVVFAALQSSNYIQNYDGLDWVVLYDLDPVGTGVPGPEISVSPPFIENDLLPNDSVDVAVFIGNLSDEWDLNWFATLEYPYPGGGEPGDILQSFDVTALTAPDFDKNMNSLVFLDDHIYIVTQPGFNTPSHLYKISKDDSEIVSKVPTPGGFGSAWSAITADDNYLYAATTYVIAKIDPNTLQTISFTPKPNFYVVTMAYDPQNDNFYLGNGGVIRKINSAGEQLNFYTIPYNVKGLAWDSWSPGGPYLWAYHQTGGQDAPIEAMRLDPETGSINGIAFPGEILSVDSTFNDIAMDIFVTPNWQENKLVMLALHSSATAESGAQAKLVITYDLATTPAPGWIKLVQPSAGVTSALSTDTLYVRLMAIMEDTLMTANLVINSNDVLNPKTYIPVNFVMLPNITTGAIELSTSGKGLIQNMFPNPAAETVNLQFSETITTGRIEIYNALGTLVFSLETERNAKSLSIDIRSFSSGIYHVIFISGNSKDQRKLMIR
jgi:hypothetical protein